MAVKKPQTKKKAVPAKKAAPAKKAVPAAKNAKTAKQGTAKETVAKAMPKKPVAKPAAKKPVAKPAPKKPVAKPAPKKPVAKPAAKKPVAKPAPKKPVAKPAPKKPVAKPVPKKPVAKPAPKKPVAKPAPKTPVSRKKKVVITSLTTVNRNIPRRPISMVKTIKPEKPLTEKEIQKAEKALLAIRDKFYRQVSAARQNVRHHNEADNSGDDGSSIFDKFLALERAGNTKDFLNRVDEALARIKEGTYGRCLNCGEPIRRVRLAVRPFARYCIKCQELLEKEESQRR